MEYYSNQTIMSVVGCKNQVNKHPYETVNSNTITLNSFTKSISGSPRD